MVGQMCESSVIASHVMTGNVRRAAMTGPKLWLSKINAYVKHAVAVAVSSAVSLGIFDGVGTIHASGWASLGAVGTATGLSLLLSYAGIGVPVKNVTVFPDDAIAKLSK